MGYGPRLRDLEVVILGVVGDRERVTSVMRELAAWRSTAGGVERNHRTTLGLGAKNDEEAISARPGRLVLWSGRFSSAATTPRFLCGAEMVITSTPIWWCSD